MKIPAAAVIAATGLVQVGALPLMLISSYTVPEEPIQPARIPALRLGHAVPPLPGYVPASFEHMGVHTTSSSSSTIKPDFFNPNNPNKRLPHPHPHRRPCGGGRGGRAGRMTAHFRAKAIKISNAIRHALGLPLIDQPPKVMVWSSNASSPSNIRVDNGFVTILPHQESSPFIGHSRPGKYGIYRDGHFHPHGQTFMRRLHYSLMNLGPWEGRAVAFVLGCGIGVLLRMFWVLVIVGYRAVKGPKPEEHQYSQVIFLEAEDAEELAVPPPSYVVDEKVPIEEAK